MGLVDYFNKWIVEHGSAVVQEKQIVFLRDQLSAADKKNAELESENGILKVKLKKCEFDLNKSSQENEKLNFLITECKERLKLSPEDLDKLARDAWNATT